MRNVRFEVDDDDEMLSRTFNELDTSKNGYLSYAELKAGLSQQKDHFSASFAIEKLLARTEIEMSQSTEISKSIDVKLFKEMCSHSPHIKGQRLEWVKSLDLNACLASKLRVGVLWDGLLGLKEMETTDILTACSEFSKEVVAMVVKQHSVLKDARDAVDTCVQGDEWEEAASQMSRFRDEPGAVVGKYGDENTFYGGLESQLGTADPYILKGILNEHLHNEDSHSGFMASNYGIYTTPGIEFARLFGNVEDINDFSPSFEEASSSEYNGPSAIELNAIEEELNICKEKFKMMQYTRSATFPGDIGDKLIERRTEYKFDFDQFNDYAMFLKAVDQFKEHMGE
jgi:hypothetical protein